MNHKRIKKLLSSYVSGSLNDKDNQYIASHIKECRNCSEEVKILTSIVAGIKSEKNVSLSQEVFESTKRRVRARYIEQVSLKEEQKNKVFTTVLMISFLLFVIGNYFMIDLITGGLNPIKVTLLIFMVGYQVIGIGSLLFFGILKKRLTLYINGANEAL